MVVEAEGWVERSTSSGSEGTWPMFGGGSVVVSWFLVSELFWCVEMKNGMGGWR